MTRHYAPEPTGSAPPMQELAEWLARNGRDVAVDTSRPTYPEARVTPGYERGQRDRAVENGVRVRRRPTSAAGRQSLLARAVPEARFLFQLLADRVTGRLRPTGPVVSLCPSILTVVAANFLVRRGQRHVVIVHDIQSGLGQALGGGATRAIMAMLRALERWALNRADAIVVLSEPMAAALREIEVTRPLTILPPQIDTQVIRPLPAPAGAPPTLMYSGNLGRKQGLDQLLDLAARLRGTMPEVRIRIRGDGAMRDAIVARIARDRLTNVELLGLVPRDAVPESLAEGDIHLVPQLAEGGDFAVPSKAFAIMAAGRPFIATATAGSTMARMATASGAYLCVPPGDVDAFAATVGDLLGDPARRRAMGEAGRSYAVDHADTAVVMRTILRLIEGQS